MAIASVSIDPGFYGGSTSAPKPNEEVTTWMRDYGAKWTQFMVDLGIPRQTVHPGLTQLDWTTYSYAGQTSTTEIGREWFETTDPITGKVIIVRFIWSFYRNTYPSIVTYGMGCAIAVGYVENFLSNGTFGAGAFISSSFVNSNNARIDQTGKVFSGCYRPGYLAMTFADLDGVAENPMKGSFMLDCWKNDNGATLTAGNEGLVVLRSGYTTTTSSTTSAWLPASSGIPNSQGGRGPFVMPIGVTTSSSAESLYLGKALILGGGKARTIENGIGYFGADLATGENHSMPLPSGVGVGTYKSLGTVKSLQVDYSGSSSCTLLARWE